MTHVRLASTSDQFDEWWLVCLLIFYSLPVLPRVFSLRLVNLKKKIVDSNEQKQKKLVKGLMVYYNRFLLLFCLWLVLRVDTFQCRWEINFLTLKKNQNICLRKDFSLFSDLQMFKKFHHSGPVCGATPCRFEHQNYTPINCLTEMRTRMITSVCSGETRNYRTFQMAQ